MKVVIKPDGDIVAVYHDTIPGNKLGSCSVTRASNVEYNHDSKQWEARLPDGTLIATGEKRSEVIQDEVAWLEERLHSL